ncbi:hypothetical protein PZE06_25145 [Robertmurraya sp. DFI.2.37]|jgi:hypothetical protein|nr:hypothetical protein [Robertmurraya sp. DFI.2.37]MDF1511392.1 hypothetical protein [Robertmurraya sp. DFI.2.37]
MKEKLLQEIYEQIEVPKKEVRDSIRKGILSTKTKNNKKVPLIKT